MILHPRGPSDNPTGFTGLYLVQWLSSQLKLRIHTALGMTIYPNIPLSQAWEKITEGTLILIIALTGGILISGLDMRIRHGDGM